MRPQPASRPSAEMLLNQPTIAQCPHRSADFVPRLPVWSGCHLRCRGPSPIRRTRLPKPKGGSPERELRSRSRILQASSNEDAGSFLVTKPRRDALLEPSFGVAIHASAHRAGQRLEQRGPATGAGSSPALLVAAHFLAYSERRALSWNRASIYRNQTRRWSDNNQFLAAVSESFESAKKGTEE